MASTVTRSRSEIAPAKAQFSTSWIWKMMSWTIIVSLRPPSRAGVMKKPSAVMNTSSPPAATPGTDRGK